MNKDLEQYFMTSQEKYEKLINSLDLRDKTVVEIGTGTGELTNLILKSGNGPKKVIGYEIDPNICKISDPRLELKIMDFTQDDLNFLSPDEHIIIANPPYSLLPFIRSMIDKFNIQKAILMTSAKWRENFTDFEVCFELDDNCFTPPTKGKTHFVIKKGL